MRVGFLKPRLRCRVSAALRRASHRRWQNILGAAVLIAVWGVQAPAVRAQEPEIRGDTTWSGQVLVDQSVTVPAGATLTIKPGTVVGVASRKDQKNQGGGPQKLIEINVFGKLVANGTAEKPVVFLAVPDKKVPKEGLDAKRPPLKGHSHWGGICFEKDSKGTLDACQISNAQVGIFVHASAPLLRGCKIFECRQGIEGGNWRRGAPTKDGPYARPKIEDCFVFRCEQGMVFINYGAPEIRNCVIADCDDGIHYLHTSVLAFPVIDHCLILRAKQGIVNRAMYAMISNSALVECEYGLVIWAEGGWPLADGEGNLRCYHNAFWAKGDPKADHAIVTYAYRDKNPSYKSVRPAWFSKNTFIEVQFRRVDFDYPPDGDWRLVDGSSLSKAGTGGGPIGLKPPSP
jgi:hypothetical protein